MIFNILPLAVALVKSWAKNQGNLTKRNGKSTVTVLRWGPMLPAFFREVGEMEVPGYTIT